VKKKFAVNSSKAESNLYQCAANEAFYKKEGNSIGNKSVRGLIVISLNSMKNLFHHENIEWASKLESYEAGRHVGSE